MSCFRKLPVANKILDKRGRGGIEIFRRNIFCLRVPKRLVGEYFCAAFHKTSDGEKLYG